MDRTYIESLLTALLRRPDNTAATVEELNSYLTDLKAGQLSELDAEYIQSLAVRLGVVPPPTHSCDVEGDERAQNSFLDIARAAARAAEKGKAGQH